MCGIAGVYIKDPSVVKAHAGLERFVNTLMLGIESRGRHASGFVAVTSGGRVVMDKADEPASKFIYSRERLPEDSRIILLHTRYATKGKPEDHVNNHPVLHGTCFTTHNGHVNNDDELFKKYGFKRNGEVDSEIIPALMGTTGFDPNKIKEVMEETRGPIAMATIDPVNHPGKLVLLRTNQSPIQIIETPKFIVWCSESKPIREAWGRVLGTPPGWRKIQYIPEYRFLVLDEKGGIQTGYKLEKPPWTSAWTFKKEDKEKQNPTPTTSSTKHGVDGSTSGDGSTTTVVVDANGISVLPSEVKAAVVVLRLRNKHQAHTWDTSEAGKRSGVRWVPCEVCGDLVDDDDFVNTLRRGRMCIDCAKMFNTLFQEKAEAFASAYDNSETTDDEDDAEVSNADAYFVDTEEYLRPDQINQLNLWGEDENEVHEQVMVALQESTGLQSEFLNYIMFRGDMQTLESNKQNKLCELVELLWRLYDEEYTSIWDAHPTSKKDDYLTILKPRAALPPGRTLARSKRILENGSAIKRKNKCLFCKKKPRFHIIEDEDLPTFNYCHKHFNMCGVRGCNADANHTRQDGIRVCHKHSRGLKGCYTDKVLREKGCTVEAVT